MLSKNVAHNIVKKKTTVGLMNALSDIYEKPSTNNKVHLTKKLFSLKIGENALMVEHLNSFNTIINQLVSLDIKFEMRYVP